MVGLLLAAGSSTRFGGDKLLAMLPDGTPIGVAAARHLLAAVDSVVAVVRPDDNSLADALADEGARITVCAGASEGMGASLAWGVRAAPTARSWLVVLADMPWIEPRTIARVGRALDEGAAIAAPTWRNARGHPVGFTASFYAALSALSGDEGAKTILAQQRVELIAVDDPGVVRDVDRPEDLAR